MLPKYKQRSYILDKLHRGVVMVLMGITVVSSVALVYEGYRYYRYVKPAMQEVKTKADEELLEEGKYTLAT